MTTAKMKRAALALPLALALLGVSYAAFVWQRDLPWQPLDLLLPHDVHYARGFRESGFRRVQPGMTVDQVTVLLGLPLSVKFYDAAGVPLGEREISSSPESLAAVAVAGIDHERVADFGFAYSLPGQIGTYYVRTVIFSHDARVRYTIARRYQD